MKHIRAASAARRLPVQGSVFSSLGSWLDEIVCHLDPSKGKCEEQGFWEDLFDW